MGRLENLVPEEIGDVEKPAPPQVYARMPYPLNDFHNYLNGWLHAMIVMAFVAAANYGTIMYFALLIVVVAMQIYVRVLARRAGQRL